MKKGRARNFWYWGLAIIVFFGSIVGAGLIEKWI